MPEDQIPNEGVCSPNMNTFWPSTPSQFSPSHSQTLFFNPNIPHDLCHPSVNRDDHGFLSYEADNRRSHAIHEDSGSIRVPLQHHGLQSTHQHAIETPSSSAQIHTLTGTQFIILTHHPLSFRLAVQTRTPTPTQHLFHPIPTLLHY